MLSTESRGVSSVCVLSVGLTATCLRKALCPFRNHAQMDPANVCVTVSTWLFVICLKSSYALWIKCGVMSLAGDWDVVGVPL